MKFFIVAADARWGIAKDYKIPWHYSEDFAWFKKKTKDCSLVMGYNTYTEIAAMRGYPEKVNDILPARMVHVITSHDIPTNERVHKESSIDFNMDSSRTFCYVGGSRIYDHAMNINDNENIVCHFGLITRIKHNYKCNKFFNHELLQKNYFLEHIFGETDDLRFELWVNNKEKNWKEKGYQWI